MAKMIKYKFLSAEINRGTEENPDIKQVFLEKYRTWSEVNEALARREAYGELEIFDDGKPDPADAPTQLDIIEAQVTYTALMTNTLLVENAKVEENETATESEDAVEDLAVEETATDENIETDTSTEEEIVENFTSSESEFVDNETPIEEEEVTTDVREN